MSTNPALLPSPALFDVTKVAKNSREGRIVRVELEQIEPAPNARRDISPDGIDRLAGIVMRGTRVVRSARHSQTRR